MDSAEEDISARVLLRKVLHTELPSSPVTRSSSPRRSMRLKNTPGLEDPGSALRHRLKKKLRESVSASPLPSPKRRRSAVAKTAPAVASPSLLYDEDMTSRGLLRGIIQMETEASLLMSGQPALQEAEPNPAESSAGERTEGLSAVELSDLTLNTEPLTHVVRGLSRRKPQRVFSVSAFERDLDQLSDKAADVSHASHRGDSPQEKPDASHDSDLSAGSKSGLNLTLKTPFVDRRSERPGLQRKVSNRRVPSVDAFDEAVQRCLEQAPDQDHSVVQDGKTLEDSSWQKFTLGLNDVTELYIHQKKDESIRLPPSQEEEEVVPSSQEAGEDASLGPKDDLVLAPMQATTESLPESQGVELQDRESFVEVDVEDGDVEERNVEDGNVEERNVEDENVEEVEDENVEERNVEDENVEEVEDENVEEVEDENVEEVEDENVEEVEDGDVEERNVEDGNMEEVEDGNVEDENVEEVEDENVEERNFEDENVEEVEDEYVEEREVEDEYVEEDEDEKIEENPDTSQTLERTTRRAHRSEGGAVLRVPASTRVTKSFGAGLNPREKDLLDLIDGNHESLQDVPDESEQAGSPVAEVTTPGRRSSQHEACLAEEDLPALAEYHDPEGVSQSEEEELVDSEPANQSPEHPQEEDEDDDDLPSAELSMKTPAFIRQKRVFASSSAQASPTVLKEVNAGPARKVSNRAPRQKRQTSDDVLPKSYVMSVFRHFAKTKVASDVYPVINEFLKKYFDRLADDLEVYATHAKRKTIEVEDFELLMRRQGFVTDSTPLNILIEKYLPLEYRKLLIPVATSGNTVIPAQRR